MRILWIAMLVACGGSSRPAQLAPLPPDPAPVEEAKAPPAPAEPDAPPKPAGPIEVTIPAQPQTVKLVGKGKGKAAPVRYAPKAGAVQRVVIEMDFTAKESDGTSTHDQIIPTIALAGEATVKAVDKDGKADYAIEVTGTSARDVPGAKATAAQFEKVLAGLAGLVISGSIDAAGHAGDVKLALATPDDLSAGALQLIQLTLPAWPVLPKEPIAPGAKWQATSTWKLADKLTVTSVTDYELVGKQGAAWSIKGATKITGADQVVEDGKITAISGSGKTEIALAEGALVPTHAATVETKFTLVDGAKSIEFYLKVGGAVTTK